MPQELRVVRCCECETFQSDIVKKSLRWSCKMCNLKQSLKRVYFTGSGKQCREFTQEMNRQRVEGKIWDGQENTDLKPEEKCDELKIAVDNARHEPPAPKKGKWDEVIETLQQSDKEEQEIKATANPSCFETAFSASKAEIADFFSGLP